MEVRSLLENVYDLERLMTRVIYQKATPCDLKALSMTVQQLPALKEQLQKLSFSRLIASLEQKISTLGARNIACRAGDHRRSARYTQGWWRDSGGLS